MVLEGGPSESNGSRHSYQGYYKAQLRSPGCRGNGDQPTEVDDAEGAPGEQCGEVVLVGCFKVIRECETQDNILSRLPVRDPILNTGLYTYMRPDPTNLNLFPRRVVHVSKQGLIRHNMVLEQCLEILLTRTAEQECIGGGTKVRKH